MGLQSSGNVDIHVGSNPNLSITVQQTTEMKGTGIFSRFKITPVSVQITIEDKAIGTRSTVTIKGKDTEAANTIQRRFVGLLADGAAHNSIHTADDALGIVIKNGILGRNFVNLSKERKITEMFYELLDKSSVKSLNNINIQREKEHEKQKRRLYGKKGEPIAKVSEVSAEKRQEIRGRSDEIEEIKSKIEAAKARKEEIRMERDHIKKSLELLKERERKIISIKISAKEANERGVQAQGDQLDAVVLARDEYQRRDAALVQELEQQVLEVNEEYGISGIDTTVGTAGTMKDVNYKLIGLRKLQNAIQDVDSHPKSDKAWGKFYAKMQIYDNEEGIRFINKQFEMGNLNKEQLVRVLNRGTELAEKLLEKGSGISEGSTTRHAEVGPVRIERSDTRDAGVLLAAEMGQQFINVLKKIDPNSAQASPIPQEGKFQKVLDEIRPSRIGNPAEVSSPRPPPQAPTSVQGRVRVPSLPPRAQGEAPPPVQPAGAAPQRPRSQVQPVAPPPAQPAGSPSPRPSSRALPPAQPAARSYSLRPPPPKPIGGVQAASASSAQSPPVLPPGRGDRAGLSPLASQETRSDQEPRPITIAEERAAVKARREELQKRRDLIIAEGGATKPSKLLALNEEQARLEARAKELR